MIKISGRLSIYCIQLLALGLLMMPHGAWAINCGRPEGIFALMMAGAINPAVSQCNAGPPVSRLNCSAQSKLFIVAQPTIQTACANRVSMHFYYTTTVGALNLLPSLSIHPNWIKPANVDEKSALFSLRSGTNIYNTSASFARGPLTPGKTVYYRWGKEIEQDNGVDPWVWSPVSSFVIPAEPPPPPPPPPAPPPPSIVADLLPALFTPTVLARALGPAISTVGGEMFAINNFFCGGLPVNVATSVDVPTLTWGVSGVNIQAANKQFSVILIDTSGPTTIDTLTLSQGFPANTPLVTKNNYPNRPTSVRVILNPRFQVGAAHETKLGCFTEPGSNQKLDPKQLIIKVDPTNLINEGRKENNNELML